MRGGQTGEVGGAWPSEQVVVAEALCMASSNYLVRVTTRLAQGRTQRDGTDGPGWRCGTVHPERLPLGTVTALAGTRCLQGVSNVRAG